MGSSKSLARSPPTVDEQLAAFQKDLTAAGQAGVFAFLPQLDEDGKKQLAADLSIIDLKMLAQMRSTIEKKDAVAESKITPFENIADLASTSQADKDAWRGAGLDAIARGEVCVLLMGGGQGTRLGFDKPKGMYDLRLPSGKTLLRLQGDKINRLRQLAADRSGKARADVSVPWYIMTSEFTHADTMAYFKASNYFGLPEKDVFFFQQSTLPCLTDQGQIILESKSHVASAPNGNGGLYEGLIRSGALTDMKTRGVKSVHVYGVDNALVKVADPTFVGFCLARGVDCGNKVVRKDNPHEKVGCMCLRDGNPSVIEYSEITKEMAESRDPGTGHLLYDGGNIAQHYFTVEFLERAVGQELPLHLAFKKISYVDSGGIKVAPPKENGYKMEMFVFDIFAFARNMHCLAVPRASEFSPLKNAAGADSPDTVRADITRLHTSLIVAAGGRVRSAAGEGPAALVEISPLLSYEGEGLRTRCNGVEFVAPFELKGGDE